jgi:UDP-N-acetylmuramate--alanine ligase
MPEQPGSLLEKVQENVHARIHFVGVGGSGMSALAGYRRLALGDASGSDRDFDRGDAAALRDTLANAGVEIVPQDGSGVPGAGLVVASTAVEASIPDLMRARELGVPVASRSELLAHHVAAEESVAVTGTSGKSTVAAMIFEILRATSRDPGIITGGPLVTLRNTHHVGNAWAGRGPLVVEADESDGSVVLYSPHVSLILNLERDHKEPDVVHEMFRTFKERTRGTCLVSDSPALSDLRDGARIWGFGSDAEFRGRNLELSPDECRFQISGIDVRVPAPGAHNAENGLAALAACSVLGVPVAEAARALGGFHGVCRRFQIVGRHRGVEVIDDYAHNPHKIRAALAAAQGRSKRVHAFFQPHGFGPTAFYRGELVRMFAETLRPMDSLCLGPIFYSGGTARRTVSSDDLAADLEKLGVLARVTSRDAWPRLAASWAQKGDLVLVLGARDTSLTLLAQAVLDELATEDISASSSET